MYIYMCMYIYNHLYIYIHVYIHIYPMGRMLEQRACFHAIGAAVDR